MIVASRAAASAPSRSARASRRLRRSRRDRPARLRQPRELPAAAAGARRRARADRRSALRERLQQQLRRGRARTDDTEDHIGDRLDARRELLEPGRLVIVVLGGIGVSSVTRVFVQQKISSIAILKCVGAPTAQVLTVYVLQVLLLGLAGSVLGVLLAGARPAGDAVACPRRRSATSRLRADAARRRCRGSASACWCRCCSRWCRCSRSGTSSRCCCCATRRRAPAPRPGAAAVVACRPRAGARRRGRAGAVAGSRAGRPARCASARSCPAGSSSSRSCCTAPARRFVRLVRPLAASRWFPLRHAVIGLGRPGNQTRVILLAVGLGCFFILGVRSLQANLLRELLGRPAARRAGHVPDRHPAATSATASRRCSTAADADAARPRLLPVLRARVVGVQRPRLSISTTSKTCAAAASLAREYTVTYRDRPRAERDGRRGRVLGRRRRRRERRGVDRGRACATRRPQRRRRMRFDVLGRDDRRAGSPASATSTGSDSAPAASCSCSGPACSTTRRTRYIGIAARPGRRRSRARGCSATGGALPERLGDRRPRGLATVRASCRQRHARRHGRRRAWCSSSGLLILIGAVAMTKFQRLYEAAILKTLGASRG